MSRSDSLINIKQRERESLRSYMSRFNEMALKVYTLDHVVTMIAIKYGLQQSPFLFSLEKGLAMDFSEMLAWVDKYACTKEAYDAHGPLSTLVALTASVVKERSLAQEFQPKRKD